MAPFVARRELTMTTIRPKPRAGSLLRSAATVFAAALLALPPAAHADPVTGGGYTPDFEGHLFRLIGADFDLRENELMFYPEWTLATCRPCFAGDMVDLSSTFDGSAGFGSGSGTIAGTFYPSLTYRGTLDFRATPVVFPEVQGPPGEAQSVLLNAPFTFTGFITAFSDEREVFARSLTGAGLASAGFIGVPGGEMWLDDSYPTYAFQAAEPVPEPATLLLAGAGLGAAARFRRARV
jgi:hypothetical protein